MNDLAELEKQAKELEYLAEAIRNATKFTGYKRSIRLNGTIDDLELVKLILKGIN